MLAEAHAREQATIEEMELRYAAERAQGVASARAARIELEIEQKRKMSMLTRGYAVFGPLQNRHWSAIQAPIGEMKPTEHPHLLQEMRNFYPRRLTFALTCDLVGIMREMRSITGKVVGAGIIMAVGLGFAFSLQRGPTPPGGSSERDAKVSVAKTNVVPRAESGGISDVLHSNDESRVPLERIAVPESRTPVASLAGEDVARLDLVNSYLRAAGREPIDAKSSILQSDIEILRAAVDSINSDCDAAVLAWREASRPQMDRQYEDLMRRIAAGQIDGLPVQSRENSMRRRHPYEAVKLVMHEGVNYVLRVHADEESGLLAAGQHISEQDRQRVSIFDSVIRPLFNQ